MSTTSARTDSPVENVIGRSEEDRPITLTLHGDARASTRVLIMAGQHGDEPIARDATRDFADDHAARLAHRLGIQIAIIADANPDGAAANRRTNIDGIDLNRDHQRLYARETRCLHYFVRTWRPHMIVDVHTFAPRRKVLLQRGLVYCHDLFFDVSTNPSVGGRSGAAVGDLPEDMLSRLFEELAGEGFRCDRYTLFRRSGRIRHSTPDVVDARNALALRYGAHTVLLEAKQPTRFDPPGKDRRCASAVVSALAKLLEWAACHRTALEARLLPPSPGQRVAIRSQYTPAVKPRELLFQNADTGKLQPFRLPKEFTPGVETMQRVRLPAAYAVPRERVEVVELLARHGFHGRERSGVAQVESYCVESVRPSARQDRPPIELKVARSEQSANLSDHIVYPVHQTGGRALAVFLEPESKYGLLRFPELNLSPVGGEEFPILRVLPSSGPKQ